MSNMHSIYCANCHTLLMKAKVIYGEVKCHKCKQLINLKFVSATGMDELLTREVKNSTINKETLMRSEEPRDTKDVS